MILIIYCHPSKTSHSFKILQRSTAVLKQRKVPFEVLDLYAMGFQGNFTEAEYHNMRTKSSTLSSDIKKIQEKISKSSTLIFIYPVWWYGMPALLKGFIDRVFTSGFAYKFFKVHPFLLWGANLLSFIPGIRYVMQPFVVTALLKDKKAIIFRTYGGPESGKRIFGNTPAALENVVLRFCGITNITIHELFNVDKDLFTDGHEKEYLDKVEKICRRLSP